MPRCNPFCLLCKSRVSLFIAVSEDGEAAEVMSEVLFRHFGIRVIITNDQSNRICFKCWSITDSFDSLYKTVNQHEQTLTEHVVAASRQQPAAKSNKVVGGGKIKCINIESLSSSKTTRTVEKRPAIAEPTIDYPSDNDDMPDNDDVNDMMSDADGEMPIFEMVLSKEENIINKDNNIDNDDETALVNLLTTAKGKATSKEPSAKTLDDFDETVSANMIPITTPMEDNDDDDDNNDDAPPSPDRHGDDGHESDIELQNEQLREYFTMCCEVCNEPLVSMQDAQDHYRTKHEKPGYLRCCAKKYFRHNIAMEHVRAHRDPKAEIELENEQIREYFAMQCELCAHPLVSIKDAQEHFRRAHNKTGYLRCCGTKFFRRNIAMDHVNAHRDPNFNRCEPCNKTFASQATLKIHRKGHLQPDGVEPVFKCNMCPAEFPIAFRLFTHKRIVHLNLGDEHFDCDICGKSYDFKSKLAFHMRRVHMNERHICHVCAKEFKSTNALEAHQKRSHAEQMSDTRVNCPVCNKLLKDRYGMERHMKRHTYEEVLCQICDKVFPNRVCLNSHMRYSHNTRTFDCALCLKQFKTNASLREHMVKHTGIDPYTCKYCPKTFHFSGSLHKHHKSAHFKKWSHDRDQKYKKTDDSTVCKSEEDEN